MVNESQIIMNISFDNNIRIIMRFKILINKYFKEKYEYFPAISYSYRGRWKELCFYNFVYTSVTNTEKGYLS